MGDREQRLGELAVTVGANVQPGQDVVVLTFDVEQAPVARPWPMPPTAPAPASSAFSTGTNMVALVDGSSPVGQTGMVFGDILLDENATSHIAWGNAYAFTMPDLPEEEAAQLALGFNRSDVHQDVMIGGPEVDVLGLDSGGAEIPVIIRDAWVLD